MNNSDDNDEELQIHTDLFPDPTAPENLLTVASNRKAYGDGEHMAVIRAGPEALVWLRQSRPFDLTEENIKRAMEQHSEKLPLLPHLIVEADKAFYSKRTVYIHYSSLMHVELQELQARIRAQDTELRQLKRQLSLTTPLAETSPSKGQAQAAAMKGKSILNPRVKRAKQSKGISFDDSEDQE